MTQNRTFTVSDARRERVPLLIGLTGPSGGGKTFSALRLATGIQEVTGGDIYFIDTESRRALHYADHFKFKHVPFEAPFGSLDYLSVLQFCVKQGAGVVVVDSMSHEHEGPGGMVDLHDQIVDRMAGNDYAKRERVKMLAWSEPKQKRRSLINGILQLNCNFIFCFRAKNTSKPVRNARTGKSEVEQMGFMPIAGEEFVFEQTLNALLMPGAGGVPTWISEQPGERTMIKLPEQFAWLANRQRPLDEKVGAGLARWARGENPAPVQDEPRASRPNHGTLSPDNPAATEGPADEQRGEPEQQEQAAAETIKNIDGPLELGAPDEEPMYLAQVRALRKKLGAAATVKAVDGIDRDWTSVLRGVVEAADEGLMRSVEKDIANRKRELRGQQEG